MAPKVPQSSLVLAALITGNHRAVARQSGANPERLGMRLARACALACVLEPLPCSVSELFESDPSEVIEVHTHEVASGPDPYARVDASARTEALALIVMLAPLGSGFEGESELGFRISQERAFAAVAHVLHSCAAVRAKVATHEVRVLAALVGHADWRIHWVGEHPEQGAILRAFRGNA